MFPVPDSGTLEGAARWRAASLRGNPRPAVRWGRGQPLTTKSFAEGVSVRRITEAEADVILLVVKPPATPPRFDAAFAMEG